MVSAKINQILAQGGTWIWIPSSHYLSLEDIPELIEKLMIDFHSATKTIQALASNSESQHEEYEDEK